MVGKNYNIPVFEMGTEVSPVEISKKALEYAAQQQQAAVFMVQGKFFAKIAGSRSTSRISVQPETGGT